ncbi:MAG: AfsR/SARP family transcriptional regulator [Streptosporangiaceae bacterium]
MGTYGGEPRAARRARGDSASAQAPTELSEALAELRRLTQDSLFNGVERALADLGHAPIGSDFGVDTVRKLRHWSAEHQRVAIELESAARCCRLVEREMNQRIDVLLEAPAARTRRRTGQFREIFRRGRAGSRPVAERPEPVAPEPEPMPAAAAPVAEYPAPEADIAASALGPLEVRVAGQRVPRWNSLKARAVFQYLLVHQDRPTRRDVLMALQWPDHSHTSARNNLNVALYSLRNTLDGPGQDAQPILYRDGCYILNPDLTWWIDRNEFLSSVDHARQARRADRPEQVIDAYGRAIQLYRGPLFEDDGAGEWYLPEQRRLNDLYGQALEDVAETHFELGQLPEALQFGQLAIGNDPCSEAMHRLLMRCYASKNQQQLVNRQYRVCAAALRAELGVAPSDETTQLLRELI